MTRFPVGCRQLCQLFGAANFAGKSWYGTSNSSTGASSYQVFQQEAELCGIQPSEYHAAFPSTAEINWAQGIINANPGMPTILQTHQYLNYDGTLLSGEGTTMWSSLVNNKWQIFMVTCGHVEKDATIDGGEAFTTATDAAGKSVYEVLSNYQSVNSGDGLMRLFQFDEANSKINVSLYSPYDNTYNNLNDSNTNFSVWMNFDARLGSVVPEPSTLVLAAAAVLSLLGYGIAQQRTGLNEKQRSAKPGKTKSPWARICRTARSCRARSLAAGLVLPLIVNPSEHSAAAGLRKTARPPSPRRSGCRPRHAFGRLTAWI